MPKAVLCSIQELPDLVVDSCITDNSCNLIFCSIWGRDTAIQEILASSAEEAKKLTGWADGDNDNSLEITTRESFIVCQLTNDDGAPRTAYFSDWILA